MAPEGGEPTLLCTGRAHKRHRTHTHAGTRVLSLYLSFSHTSARAQCTYALAPQPRDRESGIGRAFSRVYAPVCVGCWPGVRAPCTYTSAYCLLRASALVYPVTSYRVARARERGMRACVSTCERAVCLHAKRQRHAVPHTGNPSSWGPLPRPASAPRYLASLTYDTNEPQGRQVAHKTKETREKRRDSERSGGMR